MRGAELGGMTPLSGKFSGDRCSIPKMQDHDFILPSFSNHNILICHISYFVVSWYVLQVTNLPVQYTSIISVYHMLPIYLLAIFNTSCV